MKKSFLILAALILFSISAHSQYVLQKDYIEVHQTGTALYSATYKNLKIIPLFGGSAYKAAHISVGEYITLKDALNSGLLEIRETFSSGGNVNQLEVRNLSKDTVFIMAGELVSGGKQDRVIAKNILLPPGKNFVPLPVFCVEHGRWSAGSEDGASFKEHRAFTANSVRSKAVQNADQSAVWQQVDEVTTKNKSKSSTDNFNEIYANKEFMKEFNAYTEFFKNTFNDLDDCIGFLGVSGNRIVGCDIFATNELFSQQFESLIAAYITEAITENKAPSLSDVEIHSYLISFLTANKNQENMINEKGKSFEHKGKKLHIATF